MRQVGSGDVFIRPNAPEDAKSKIIPLGNVGWTPSGNRIRFKPDPTTFGRNNYIQRDKSLGTDLERRMQVMPRRDIEQDTFLDNEIGDASKNKITDDIKYDKKMETLLSQSFVNALEITRSEFCVSSEDGQNLYNSIRSALLDGKNVLISFEGITDISSAFLDEAISNLYNGEFNEEELKQKINYKGLSQEDSFLLRNIIEWAKEDFVQRAPTV